METTVEAPEGAPQGTELSLNFHSALAVGSTNLVLSKPKDGFRRGPHEHSHAYLSLVVSGGWREIYRGQSRESGPGDVALHLPEATHSRVETLPGTLEFYLEVEQAGLPPEWSSNLKAARPSSFRPLLHALFANLRSGARLPLHLETLTAELIGETFDPSRRHTLRTNAWLREVRESLEADLTEIPSLGTLARRVGTHPSNLARTFRATYGISVGQYAQRLRIDKALQQLQRTDQPLKQIAAETGFADQSHFGRIFRRMIGVSPARYRKLLRN